MKLMELKFSLIFGLVVATVFPLTSFYVAWSGGKGGVLDGPESAVEAAIEYLIFSHKELKELKTPESWKRENITPEGLDGATILRFTGADWTVTVRHAPIRPSNYEIEIDFTGEGGFHWEGRVDLDGKVVENIFELISG